MRSAYTEFYGPGDDDDIDWNILWDAIASDDDDDDSDDDDDERE